MKHKACRYGEQGISWAGKRSLQVAQKTKDAGDHYLTLTFRLFFHKKGEQKLCSIIHKEPNLIVSLAKIPSGQPMQAIYPSDQRWVIHRI
jgi:hypothetical protein